MGVGVGVALPVGSAEGVPEGVSEGEAPGESEGEGEGVGEAEGSRPARAKESALQVSCRPCLALQRLAPEGRSTSRTVTLENRPQEPGARPK